MGNGRVFRQHWLIVLLPATVETVSFFVLLYLIVAWAMGRVPLLLAVPFILSLLWGGWRVLQWQLHYVIFTADGRLLCYKGILRQQTVIPLRFSKVITRSSVIGKIFDFGTLEIGSDSPYVFNCIEQFSRMQRILQEGRGEQLPAWQGGYPIVISMPTGEVPKTFAARLPTQPTIAQPRRMLVDGEYREL